VLISNLTVRPLCDRCTGKGDTPDEPEEVDIGPEYAELERLWEAKYGSSDSEGGDNAVDDDPEDEPDILMRAL
jgi:hypothetical protein